MKIIVSLTVVAVLSLMATTAAFAGHKTEPPDKVTICHKPGTPAEKTLVIPHEAWEKGHNNHGDTLGPCGQGKIAFASVRDGYAAFHNEIYVMNADGSGQTRLASNSATDYQPAWSPNGSKIAFASDRDGNFEVYVMNADGSGQTRLTSNPADDFYPAWSPDGSRIAFTSERDGNGEVYVMNADGSGLTKLTSNSAEDYYPDWGP